MFLCGGNTADDNADIYPRFVKSCGGIQARIGLVTAASDDPEGSATFYADLLVRGFGAGEAVWIPVDEKHKGNASDPAIVKDVERMTGFLFGGGDQARVIASFFAPRRCETPVLSAIRKRFEAGAPVLGTSAGTACQPMAPMIEGGLSYDALVYGGHDKCSESRPDDLCYDRDGGIGFFGLGFIDSHFSHRGRQGRFVRMVSELSPATLAFGIDENTALLTTVDDVAGSATGTVLGAAGVWVLNLNQSKSGHDRFWHIRHVIGAYATGGDTVDLRTGRVSFAPGKTSLTGREHRDFPSSTTDVFNSPNRSPRTEDIEFVRVAISLFDSRHGAKATGETYETDPAFRVTFSREPGSSEGADGKNAFGDPVISMRGCDIDIEAL